MGTGTVTHQKNVTVKQIVLFKPIVIVCILKLGIQTNGLTSQCSENIQLPQIIKGEIDAYYYLEEAIRNPAVIIQYLNTSLGTLAPQLKYPNPLL